MPHYLVTRSVRVDQVVLVRAESEEAAREKGWNGQEGHIQYSEPIEVEAVTDVEGDA